MAKKASGGSVLSLMFLFENGERTMQIPATAGLTTPKLKRFGAPFATAHFTLWALGSGHEKRTASLPRPFIGFAGRLLVGLLLGERANNRNHELAPVDSLQYAYEPKDKP